METMDDERSRDGREEELMAEELFDLIPIPFHDSTRAAPEGGSYGSFPFHSCAVDSLDTRARA